ncbi:MAG TPA: c-type cytochrome [Thermoanaerobaculia bacterium]|nr:c-type cytochrome [Thermoanaerobaculia bacterium]
MGSNVSVRRLAFIFVPIGLAAVVVTALAAGEPTDAGKAVFLKEKCGLCHAVKSQGLERTLKTSKAKDLSNVGVEREAAWIEKWLKHEEAIDGKKHEKVWKGSDQDLANLIQWLGTLKTKQG